MRRRLPLALLPFLAALVGCASGQVNFRLAPDEAGELRAASNLGNVTIENDGPGRLRVQNALGIDDGQAFTELGPGGSTTVPVGDAVRLRITALEEVASGRLKLVNPGGFTWLQPAPLQR